VNEQQANDMAQACLSKVVLDTHIERLRTVVNALLGIYEEQMHLRQYDILSDGSV